MFAFLKACFPQTTDKERRLQNWKATGSVGLRDSGLKALPSSVETIADSVKVLDATNNSIRELPEYIGTMKNLGRLILVSNQLKTFQGSVCVLPNLKILSLDANQLTSLPDEIGNLVKLEKLTAANNSLSSLPATIGRLANMRHLGVAGNSLTSLPGELGSCPNLEEVDASNNSIAGIPAQLGKLQKLKTVNLDGNKITSVPSEVFKGCSAMQTLSLHSNPITAEILEETPGYEEFNTRRKSKFDKAIAGGALLSSAGLDEGVDRPTAQK